MCKQLLDITSAIDPTTSRLALYSSVVEQEYASAILILAERKFWKDHELVEKLKDAKKFLIHGLKSLEPEGEDSQGFKFVPIITKTLHELETFSAKSNVSL
mgnify:FL=1